MLCNLIKSPRLFSRGPIEVRHSLKFLNKFIMSPRLFSRGPIEVKVDNPVIVQIGSSLHDYSVVAPLKLSYIEAHSIRNVESPRLFSRGPIEVYILLIILISYCSSPRLFSRGPIEAESEKMMRNSQKHISSFNGRVSRSSVLK